MVARLGAFAPRAMLHAYRPVVTFAGLVLTAVLTFLYPLRLPAQSSICAEVKIEIDQKVSLERQAFEAVLKIRNGLDGVAVENININVTFLDLQGNSVIASSDPNNTSATFFIRQDLMVGIVDGAVAPLTTGEAHWLIIPAQNSGGSLPQGLHYQVGATVTYRISGEDKSVDVIPELITVRPQPLLNLDYFLPGNVYADDPLTPIVEPTVPFTLGVRITNSGFGAASHTTIESAQPKIVDNAQGLLIGFQIAGSYVDDQPAQPTLLLDFGDIDPGVSRIGRWIMTTTLSGQFFDFDAEYTHADDLGGALTSLLGTVTPYLLTHDVLVDLPGRDGIRDFLAQAASATQDTDTYRVYESDGTTSEVAQQFSPTFTGSSLSFPALAPGLLVYARASITFDGQALPVSATRSDGKAVPSGNVWFSKRRNASGDGWLYFLNLFEASPSTCAGTCTYALTYDGAPSDASITGVVYDDANGNGVQDAGEPGMPGVEVALIGGSNPLSANSASDGTFQFANLSAGSYALTVGAVAGYYDGLATIGTAGGTASANSITGIALDSATQAIGYAFAKVPQPAQRVADLAVTSLAAGTTTPRVGETFTLTMAVANAGPDTAGVDGGLTLPSSVSVVSANPSVGTFDPVSGHWAIGDLSPSGTAVLTVQARATAEGDMSIAASVSSSDASILDPNAANNTAALSLHVDPATAVRVTPSFARESRILAFVGCPRSVLGGGTSLQCVPNRVSTLDTYLAGRSLEHQVVSDAATFRAELRSGRWNVYWIDNGTAKVDDDVLAEVGLAVLRGDSLIIDGAHDTGTSVVDGWTGVSYSGIHGTTAAEAVTFVSNPYLSFPGLSVTGSKYAYQLTSGTVLAKYPDNAPAIVLATHGTGRILLFAYDLVASVSGNPAYAPLFDQIVTTSKPQVPDFFTADAYVPVNLHLENLGDAVTVNETLTVPTGTRIIKVVPSVFSSSIQQVSWQSHLAASGTFDAMAGIRTTPDSTTPITVDVVQSGGASLAHEELALTVRSTSDQSTTVVTEISALPVSSFTDTGLRASALTAINSAATSHAAGRPDQAIASVLSADTDLIQIVGADTSVPRADLARLLQAYEREWYAMLSSCGTTSQAPIVDSGVSFSPYGATTGLYLHQLTTGGFEWRLGSDTSSSTDSVAGTTTLVSGQTYQWTLSYDGVGNGTITVNSGATQLLSQTYTAATSSKQLKSGNAIDLYVEALVGTGTTSISVATTSLDGQFLSGSLNATSTSTGKPGTASLYYYAESLADGFVLSGTISGTVPRSGSSNPPPPRISFRVNAGSLSCKLTAR